MPSSKRTCTCLTRLVSGEKKANEPGESLKAFRFRKVNEPEVESVSLPIIRIAVCVVPHCLYGRTVAKTLLGVEGKSSRLPQGQGEVSRLQIETLTGFLPALPNA